MGVGVQLNPTFCLHTCGDMAKRLTQLCRIRLLVKGHITMTILRIRIGLRIFIRTTNRAYHSQLICNEKDLHIKGWVFSWNGHQIAWPDILISCGKVSFHRLLTMPKCDQKC